MRIRHLSYANIASTLALVVALGAGGAYAATQLPKNSVGAKQIKNNAVKTTKIANNAVTGDKVKNGSLTAADLKAGTIPVVPPVPEATVTRHTTSAELDADGFSREILTVPGDFAIWASCTDFGSNSYGMSWTLTNLRNSAIRFVSRAASESQIGRAHV